MKRDYLLAIATTVGLYLAWYLTPLIGNQALSVFLLAATFIAGRRWGRGPAVVSLLLGALPYVYVQHARHGGYDAALFSILGVYFSAGTFLVWMTHCERRSRQLAEASAREASETKALLEQEIVERRLAEQELRERHERLEMALETGRIGAFDWDLSSGRAQWSPTMAAIYGSERRETTIDFEESLRRIHPDDLPKIRGAIAENKEPPVSERTVFRVIWPDGSVHWVEGLGRKFVDADGNLTRVIGFCVDITERKQAELALRQAEERFRQLAVMAPVGIAQSDAAGQTFFANDRFQQILGLPKETVMGSGWQAAIHPLDRQATLDAWLAAVSSGQDFLAHEFRLLYPDGQVRWAIGSAALLRDDQGAVVGQIGSLQDITEIKAAELAVQAGQAQLQQFIDNAPSLFYSKDKQGRYLLVNQRFLDAYRITREQALGHTGFEIFSPEVAQSYADNDAIVWREGQPRLFEERDAQQNTFIAIKFPLRDHGGAMVAIGGVSTDITERKRILADLHAERELLRNIIAVQENEKRLLCCEFHDGVLQYVTGSQMQLEGCRRSNTPMAEADLDKVIASLRRAAEEGRQAIRGLRPPALDEMGLVAAIFDLIHQPAYADLEIDFVFDELDRLPDLLESSFYRVAQESLNNVKKHSGAKKVEISLRRRDDDLTLKVRDFGRGFDADRRRPGSFGLLGMSERLRMLGGECAIETRPGEGTLVRARAPLVKQLPTSG